MASRRHNSNDITIRFFFMHPAVWFVLATSGLVYLAIFSWSKNKDRFLDAERFQLTMNRISFNPMPEWAEALSIEPLTQISSTDESLLDLELVPAVSDYLRTVPWIRKIQRIEKSADGLEISVACREPVALVGDNTSILIDGDGFVFDNAVLEHDQFQQTMNQAIRINMPFLDKRPSIAWHRRNDSRVQHAAQLAEFLHPAKDELQVYRIITHSRNSSESSPPKLEAWTANGTRVKWGSAPGHEKPGEVDSMQKLAALQEFISQYGDLVQFEHRETHAIDVSSGRPVVVKDARIANSQNWLDDLK